VAELGLIGLGHVAIFVSDIERSRAFYKEVLGFEDVWDCVHENGTRLHFMKTHGVTIELVKRGGGRSQRDGIDGTINHLCMQVENLDEAMAALKEKGIEFQSEEYDPLLYPNGERNAIFRGPDDERLQIEQIL